MIERPGLCRLDERPADPASSVFRVDAHLLDMCGPIDDVEQEIAEGLIGGVDGDKSPALLGVRRKLRDRTWVVVGDSVHTQGAERLPRGPFDLDQPREIVMACRPDGRQDATPSRGPA